MNQNGSAIIIAVLITAALSLAVFIAMDNAATSSKVMRYSREYRDSLYKAETGISVAAEENRSTWLKSDSKLFKPTADFSADPDEASFSHSDITIKDEQDQPILVASYEIARIEKFPLQDSFSSYLYKMNHQAPPPIGSGSSPKSFEIRRYGIRSTAEPEGTLTIESGLYKYFNKL